MKDSYDLLHRELSGRAANVLLNAATPGHYHVQNESDHWTLEQWKEFARHADLSHQPNCGKVTIQEIGIWAGARKPTHDEILRMAATSVASKLSSVEKKIGALRKELDELYRIRTDLRLSKSAQVRSAYDKLKLSASETAEPSRLPGSSPST